MVGVGPCRMCVWECPTCGEIHGGVAEGGVIHLCRWCPHRGVCSVKQGEEDPRSIPHLEVAEVLCWSVDCILAQITGERGRYNV
jgi:hypothetical protein